MTKRISFKVEGQVQGVNYRSNTRDQAKKLGLTGHVENASDGSVTGEAQGAQSKLQEFVEYLKEGPAAAKPNNVETSDIETKSGEDTFS